MVILALDTSTSAGSAALADEARAIEVAALDPSQPVATRVPADLIALLERHAVPLSRIDVFAVATGPGSFTGLRIGIAAMQGLALAGQKPLVGVSSFEALASLADAAHVGVWIDAWRGEVYAAAFERMRMTDAPMVGPPDAVLAHTAKRGERSTAFIGDGAVRYRDRLPRVTEPTPLLAGAIARLAIARAHQGELPPPHAIRPLYVRRPDAELARDRP
jgi:tRNA threonylcarbamoyladenosine biosynthesis protein TsaB